MELSNGDSSALSRSVVGVSRNGWRPTWIRSAVALVSGLAGLVAAGLALSIGLLLGEGFPAITPGRALTTAIPVELLIVPLGVAIAWLELGRSQVQQHATYAWITSLAQRTSTFVKTRNWFTVLCLYAKCAHPK